MHSSHFTTQLALLLAIFVRLSTCAVSDSITPSISIPITASSTVTAAGGAVQTQKGSMFNWDPSADDKLKVAANVKITLGDPGDPLSGCTIAEQTSNNGTCPYPPNCPSTGKFSVFIFALQKSGSLTNDEGKKGTYTVTVIIEIDEDFTGGCTTGCPSGSGSSLSTSPLTGAGSSIPSPTSGYSSILAPVNSTSAVGSAYPSTTVTSCLNGQMSTCTFVPMTDSGGVVSTKTVGGCSTSGYSTLSPSSSGESSESSISPAGGVYPTTTPSTPVAGVTTTPSAVPSTPSTPYSYGSASSTVTSTLAPTGGVVPSYTTTPSLTTTPSTLGSSDTGSTINDAIANTPPAGTVSTPASGGTEWIPQVTTSGLGTTSPVGTLGGSPGGSPYYTQAAAGARLEVPIFMSVAGGLLGGLFTFVFL